MCTDPSSPCHSFSHCVLRAVLQPLWSGLMQAATDGSLQATLTKDQRDNIVDYLRTGIAERVASRMNVWRGAAHLVALRSSIGKHLSATGSVTMDPRTPSQVAKLVGRVAEINAAATLAQRGDGRGPTEQGEGGAADGVDQQPQQGHEQ